MKNNSVIKLIAILMILAMFLAFVYDLTTETLRSPSYIFLMICTAVAVAVFYKNLPRTAVFYTILAGIVVKISYVIYTPVWCRQHDVVDFGAGEGHAAYIEYILSHKALPDFDPREVWAFFQPPLHHIISAVWMWINLKAGLAIERVHKNVQILPLIYMCALMITVLFICRQLKMRSGGTVVTMLIVSFHPIYILMSGSINNDALSVVLTVMAIYAALLWYERPTVMRIAALALLIGLSMMAKLSSAMIAPAVAVLMLYRIMTDTDRLKDRAKLFSYLPKIAVFAVIVFPIGLWWTVRNKILFDMPAGYIPEVGEAVEKYGIVPTLLDIRTASPFLYMKANGFSYDEYNLILATLKSSLFGEGDFANVSPILTACGWIMLISLVVVTVLQIVSLVKTCMSSEAGPDRGIKIFLALGIVTFVAAYIAFALSGKNLSAMDFRYSAAAVSLLSVFLGLRYDRLDALGEKTRKKIIMIPSLVFAASSAAFYIMAGF